MMFLRTIAIAYENINVAAGAMNVDYKYSYAASQIMYVVCLDNTVAGLVIYAVCLYSNCNRPMHVLFL